MRISITTISGSRERDPKLKIDLADINDGPLLVHDLSLESVRDAAFILSYTYHQDYITSVQSIKAALSATTYDVPEDTMEWVRN